MKTYKPQPVDTSEVSLPYELIKLTDKLAENTHEVWAAGRIKEGWTYGETRNDKKKTNPFIVPYDKLPDSEKEYDKNTSIETIKLILKLGYRILSVNEVE